MTLQKKLVKLNYTTRLSQCWNNTEKHSIVTVSTHTNVYDPSKHETLRQYWISVGPPSTTLVQHWTTICSFSRVCWDVTSKITQITQITDCQRMPLQQWTTVSTIQHLMVTFRVCLGSGKCGEMTTAPFWLHSEPRLKDYGQMQGEGYLDTGSEIRFLAIWCRACTLPLGHGGSQKYWIFTSERGRCQSGVRDLRP